jgi:hypothetical protein
MVTDESCSSAVIVAHPAAALNRATSATLADSLKRHVCLPLDTTWSLGFTIRLAQKILLSTSFHISHHGACTKSPGFQHISTFDQILHFVISDTRDIGCYIKPTKTAQLYQCRGKRGARRRVEVAGRRAKAMCRYSYRYWPSFLRRR